MMGIARMVLCRKLLDIVDDDDVSVEVVVAEERVDELVCLEEQGVDDWEELREREDF